MQTQRDSETEGAKREDGGPAFPHHETTSTGEPFHDHLGMTLRDYFASKALAQISPCAATIADKCAAGGDVKSAAELIAQCSYIIADAMIAHRSKS